MTFLLNADYVTCLWQVPENIFIQYDSAEEIVRYALSAKLAPLEGKSVCRTMVMQLHYACNIVCTDVVFLF